ncbi:hypothetical protein DEO72_LG7g2515 [Vigna unguiculata]|uniref:Uncharacterized protein n=1 Tax=Vigna unguiculata TaxID=3917 RepID=A0A4D6MKM6_VIGUN|nr:hypothetical protein DEO72_LG7g2515 [Vigna unguiculata]
MGLVIDFFTSRASARQWSSIFYIKALSFGMVIDSLCHIETLSMGMVIDSFASRPSAKQWSLISWLHQGPLRGNGHRFLYIKTLSFGMVIDSLCHIETLSMGLVIDSFASRPSAKQWSLISWLHQGPLRGNGHRFLYIKTLSFGMVIDSLCRVETLSVRLVVDSFTSRPSARQWSLIS